MAIIFFADVKADPTLKGDVQKKISDAFGIVVELQQSNIPVLDYKVDVPSNPVSYTHLTLPTSDLV